MSELEKAIEQAEVEGADPRFEPGLHAEEARYEPRFELLDKMSCGSIAEMSDAQLENFIGAYQELIYRAEQGLESKRAKLGAGKLEKAERATRRKSKTLPQAVPQAALDLAQAVDMLAAQVGAAGSGNTGSFPDDASKGSPNGGTVTEWLKRHESSNH